MINIINLFDPEGFEPGNSREKYKSSYKQISEKMGTKDLGFHIKIMQPKTFSFPYHWHSKEEELAIVLQGEATVRINNQFHSLKPGDLVYFGTGPESAHHIYNHSDQPFKFLALSNQEPEDMCYYPDSNKQNDRGLITQNGQKVEYFKDEEDPSVYWPKDKLE